MRGLSLCCEGIEDDINLEPQKIIVPNKTQSWQKPTDASVIPRKRKCVKNMMCSCFVQCFCDKCLNTKTKTKTKTKAVYGAEESNERVVFAASK